MIARILTILRKDVRRLWPNVLVFWAVMVSVAVLNATLSPKLAWNDRDFLESLPPLQWLACVLLVVQLVQQERLAGHDQYWLARPISWPELLAAKAIFLAALVNLRVWICQCAIWPAEPWSHQVPLTVFAVLPAAAFAAVTRHLGQSIICFFAVIVTLAGFAPAILNFTRPPEPAAAIIAIVCGAVILLQYSRRQEVLARSVLVAGAAGLVLLSAFLNRAP